jgi:hypothetical protein
MCYNGHTRTQLQGSQMRQNLANYMQNFPGGVTPEPPQSGGGSLLPKTTRRTGGPPASALSAAGCPSFSYQKYGHLRSVYKVITSLLRVNLDPCRNVDVRRLSVASELKTSHHRFRQNGGLMSSFPGIKRRQRKFRCRMKVTCHGNRSTV